MMIESSVMKKSYNLRLSLLKIAVVSAMPFAFTPNAYAGCSISGGNTVNCSEQLGVTSTGSSIDGNGKVTLGGNNGGLFVAPSNYADVANNPSHPLTVANPNGYVTDPLASTLVGYTNGSNLNISNVLSSTINNFSVLNIGSATDPSATLTTGLVKMLTGYSGGYGTAASWSNGSVFGSNTYSATTYLLNFEGVDIQQSGAVNNYGTINNTVNISGADKYLVQHANSVIFAGDDGSTPQRTVGVFLSGDDTTLNNRGTISLRIGATNNIAPAVATSSGIALGDVSPFVLSTSDKPTMYAVFMNGNGDLINNVTVNNYGTISAYNLAGGTGSATYATLVPIEAKENVIHGYINNYGTIAGYSNAFYTMGANNAASGGARNTGSSAAAYNQTAVFVGDAAYSKVGGGVSAIATDNNFIQLSILNSGTIASYRAVSGNAGTIDNTTGNNTYYNSIYGTNTLYGTAIGSSVGSMDVTNTATGNIYGDITIGNQTNQFTLKNAGTIKGNIVITPDTGGGYDSSGLALGATGAAKTASTVAANAGTQYKIASIGTTTQAQWNTLAGTTGVTYSVGSVISAVGAGAGTGTLFATTTTNAGYDAASLTGPTGPKLGTIASFAGVNLFATGSILASITDMHEKNVVAASGSTKAYWYAAGNDPTIETNRHYFDYVVSGNYVLKVVADGYVGTGNPGISGALVSFVGGDGVTYQAAASAKNTVTIQPVINKSGGNNSTSNGEVGQITGGIYVANANSGKGFSLNVQPLVADGVSVRTGDKYKFAGNNINIATGASETLSYGAAPTAITGANISLISSPLVTWNWQQLSNVSQSNMIQATVNDASGIAGISSNGAKTVNALMMFDSQLGSQFQNLTDAESVRKAAEQARPEINGATHQASMNVTDKVFGLVGSRLDEIHLASVAGRSGIATGDETRTADGTGVWMQAFGAKGNQDRRANTDGYSTDAYGFAIGADQLIDDETRVGFVGSYGQSRVLSQGDNLGDRTSIDSYQGAIYGSTLLRKLYLNATLGLGYHDYTSNRLVLDNGIKGSHDAWQYSGKLDAGYPIKFSAVTLVPVASLAYSHLAESGYTESGVGALSIGSRDTDSFKTGLGAKALVPLFDNAVSAGLELRALWQHEFADASIDTTARFVEGGASFTTKGVDLERDSANLGASLRLFGVMDGVKQSLNVNYDAEVKSQYINQTASLQARFDF